MELPMTSTQVSFAAFALAQQAASCTPPAAIPDAAPVVAHGLGVGSGGECSLRERRRSLLRERRCDQPGRYVAVGHYPWGPEVYRWDSRAWAWNHAQRYGLTFVDLGATA